MFPVALKAAAAAAAGAIVVLAVAAGSTGGLPAGAGWAAAAGAFACMSGLVLGTGGRRAPAAAFGAAAIAALAIAPTGGEDVRAAPRVLAMKAPAERLRGDASAAARAGNPTGANSERLRGDASAAARAGNPTGANSERLHGDAGGDETAERRDESVPNLRERAERRFRGDVSTQLEAFVRGYYADLDAHRYRAAWARLAPSVRHKFGDFTDWRDGYRTTVAHTVEDLAAAPTSVTHTLVASCGASAGRYAVRWRFEGAKAVAVTAEALSGTAC